MISFFLDKTAAVERQTVRLDPTNANDPTWGAARLTVACTLQPYRHGREEFPFDRDDSLNYYVVYTAIDIAATTQDRLTINGVHYPVVAYRKWENANFWSEPYYATLVALRNTGT